MLKRFLLVIVLVVAGAALGIALHTSLTGGETVFAGKRPDYIGVKDGQLARCMRTPNCVSSQADRGDAEHHIAPIAFKGSALEALAAVRKALDGMARTHIVRHDANYLYAEVTSKLMGFIDDVEFTFDEKAGAIHLRSASRLGRRDFGVNRARIEAIRSSIERRLKT